MHKLSGFGSICAREMTVPTRYPVAAFGVTVIIRDGRSRLRWAPAPTRPRDPIETYWECARLSAKPLSPFLPRAMSMSATSVETPVTGNRPLSEVDLLQGPWSSVAGPKECRLLVAGNRFAFEFLDSGVIYIGTYLLDTRAEPKQMDMRIEAGPPAYQGQLALCIYHLESDVLRWCPTRPGSNYRLDSFPSIDDDRYLSLVFKHSRPLRKR